LRTSAGDEMAERSMEFGPELRRLRIDAGWSLGELARSLHYSKGYLSKIENGEKQPSAEVARRCDTALHAEGRLAELLPARRRRGAQSVAALEYGDEVWVMSLDPDGTSRFVPLNRRDALATGIASLLGVALARPRTSAAARQEATASTLQSLFDQYRQLGQVVSPGVVLPPLIAQANAARACARAASGPMRRRLFEISARYAEYTGWMAQESGNDDAAEWWTGLAVKLAAEGGDRAMAAYAQVRRALIALYRDDAMHTIDLARQAQVGRDVAVRIRGLAAQREAQGHALAGDYSECRRALDRAADLLAAARAQAAGPVLGTSTVADPAAVATGWCLYDLGRVRQSAEILTRALEDIPPTARRSQARYGARLALALTGAGEIDHACAVTHQTLDHAELVDSATIRVDLRRLARALGRWRSHPPVSQLSPRLTAALRSHRD
jgi:transcriptional regulator with XRE-family HTH domain